MIKNVGVCAAIGAGLLATYVVAGGPAFWFAAIAAGMVAVTYRQTRGLVDQPASARAFPWVFCVVLIGMVGMVISMGVRQMNPMYLLMLAMMALGWYSAMSSRGQAAEQR